MNFKGKNLDVDKLVDALDITSSFHTYYNNNILLSKNQINILERNQIDYKKYTNLSALIFDVEEVINNNPDFDLELDNLLEDLSEISYYRDTKK